ncbi:hypothetical protein ASPCAL11820 [Aspergillus calidoustus]|uniref:C6 finger domain protein n=1 Tax=Aspergillus calidoustus TaxID=454130 RepID=A0A0U5GAW0_ASPCI|nr:hypothetical protein ASPCAL11820 [Aspergillus calidoustus]
MSNRDCSFASDAKGSTQTSSPAEPTTTFSPPSSSENALEEINLKHMELLIHLTTTNGMFNLGDDIGPYPTGIAFALKRGLDSPYLLYASLAFSARHLAYLHPERSAEFIHQAVTLQTRALALFNVDKIQVDKSNCVAILLFSAVVGHHLLADTLMEGSQDGLSGFLKRYVHCARTHRGLYSIMMTAQPLLMETELEPVLSRSISFTSQDPKGMHCQTFRDWIMQTYSTTQEEREACLCAIRYLQLGFDALSPSSRHHSMQYQMLFLWSVLVPPEFIAMLTIKQPFALVVLAYYALLLHHGRHMWQVGGAGEYLFGMIEGYLGSPFVDWLEYPRAAIRGSRH